MRRHLCAIAFAAAASLCAARCGGGSTSAPTVPVSPTGPVGPTGTTGATGGVTTAVLVGAGDIGLCNSPGTALTGRLIASTPGTVFAAGDNAYMNGTAQEFASCYDPFWGNDKGRTHPVLGNHESDPPGDVNNYFNYFGFQAGTNRPGGWYSYEVGDWHILALNSSDRDVSNPSGAQFTWLKQDLLTHPAKCTMAIWHHPRFSSGPNGSTAYMDNMWRFLYAQNVDVVVNGHDHVYERFAPQTPDAVPDSARGIREFVVGTGGAAFYDFVTRLPNSEVQIAHEYGVVKFTLSTGSYTWEFIPASGGLADAGSGVCH